MSWWTKNRKYLGLLAAAAAAATGVGAPAVAGLLGTAGAGAAGAGAAGAGAAGAGAAAAPGMLGALVGEGAIPMAAMGGEAALAASQAMTPIGQAAGYAGTALKGLNTANRAMGAASGMGLLGGGGPPPPPAPPPPQQTQQLPTAPLFGDQMPPELRGLPPDDPRVIEWKQRRGMR